MRKFFSVLFTAAVAATMGALPFSVSNLPAASSAVTVAHLVQGADSKSAPSPRFAVLLPSEHGPGRWNPCVTIRWKFNAVGFNEKRFGQTVSAFRQLRRATGLKIRFDGFASPEEIALLEPGVITVSFLPAADLGEAVGSAGVEFHTREGSAGEIVRADVRVAIHAGLDGPHGYVPVLLHELGHAVGLDHSGDERSSMFAFENGVARYNASDLAGFKRVGAANGCFAPAVSAVP